MRSDDARRRRELHGTRTEKLTVETAFIEMRHIHDQIFAGKLREQCLVPLLVAWDRIDSARVLPHAAKLVRARVGMRNDALHITTSDIREASPHGCGRPTVDATPNILFNKNAVERHADHNQSDKKCAARSRYEPRESGKSGGHAESDDNDEERDIKSYRSVASRKRHENIPIPGSYRGNPF